MSEHDGGFDPIPLASGPAAEDLEPPRWQCTIPGHNTAVWADPEELALYVCAGWGVAFAAIRLRKIDALTGRELASARLGNSVGAVHVPTPGGEIYATTDTRLFRLDRGTLQVVQRWEQRVPGSTYAMRCTPSGLLMAHNGDWLAVFDLTSGKARKKGMGMGMSIFTDGPDLMLFSRGSGDLWRQDPKTGAWAIRAQTFQAAKAAFDPLGRTLWLCGAGQAWAQSHPHLRHRIGRLELASPSPRLVELEAGFPVGTLAVCGNQLLVVEISPAGGGSGKWSPTALHSFRLPDLTPVAKWRFEAPPSCLYLLPSLAAVVAIAEADHESVVSLISMAGVEVGCGESTCFRSGWDG